ncbi:MAG: hemerythrin domain-containing protein [Desulfurellaceae bacterium]|nr:hemerythrin domain-containing protein [Desulfurellaceae bacterium]
MAKRHPSLVPLSREHHVALLLAFRLVHGLPPSRQANDSPQAQARDTVRFFQTKLVTHFRAEEQALFPLIRKTQPHAIPLIDTLLAEHADMRARVHALEQADPSELPAQLTAFGQLLERHVRSEERELFPLCEARLTADEAERLRAAIVGFVGEGR